MVQNKLENITDKDNGPSDFVKGSDSIWENTMMWHQLIAPHTGLM